MEVGVRVRVNFRRVVPGPIWKWGGVVAATCCCCCCCLREVESASEFGVNRASICSCKS